MSHKIIGKGRNGIIMKPPFNSQFSTEKGMVSKLFKNHKNYTVETYFYKEFFPSILDPDNNFTLRYYGDFTFDDDEDYDERTLKLIKKELGLRKNIFYELVIEDGGENLISTDRVVHLIELLDIVRYIHSKNVLHLDIYQENIMYNGRIIFIDFELACKASNLYTTSNDVLFMSAYQTYKFPPEFRIASFIITKMQEDDTLNAINIIREFDSLYRDDLYIKDLFEPYFNPTEFYKEYDIYLEKLLQQLQQTHEEDPYEICNKVFRLHAKKIDMYSLGLQLLLQNIPKNERSLYIKRLIHPNPYKRYSSNQMTRYINTHQSTSSSQSTGGTVFKSQENAIKQLKNVLAHSIKKERTLEEIKRAFR